MTSLRNKIKIRIKPLESVWVNVARFLMSAIFIFSGFVKALDPKGTGYKFDAYMAKFGLANFINEDVTLALSVLLASLEFLLGIYLLFGIRRRFTTAVLLIVMCVFTPFTLYLAIANPVHDFLGHFVDQQYFPDALKEVSIWKPQENPAEEKLKERMNDLWKRRSY